MRKQMAVFAAAAVLSGCTFPLCCADLKPGQGVADRREDIIACQEQAENFANHPGQSTGQFLLGATLIGLPIGYQWEKNMKQTAWADCMKKRGYVVSPPPG